MLQYGVFALDFSTNFRQFLNSRVDFITMRTFKIFAGLLEYLFEKSLSCDIVVFDLFHFMRVLFDIRIA